jgi:hypothetical protein
MISLNKTTFITLFLIISVLFLLNVLTFKKGHNWYNTDFAAYVHQSKSIVEGKLDSLYSMDQYRYEKSTRATGSLMAPWGFPLLLSPVYYFFGLNIFAMKVYINLFFVLSLWIMFLLFQDRLHDLENLFLVSIMGFSTWFFEFKENVLSDFPFLFFSLASLLLIKRFIIQNKIWINKFVSYSLIGLLIFISYSIRSVGLVLLPTLFIVQFSEARSSSNKFICFPTGKVNFIPYIIFLIFTAALSLILPGGVNTAYFDILSSWNIDKFLFEIKYYTFLPPRFFHFLNIRMNASSFVYSDLSLIIYFIMLIFVMIGMIRGMKKDYIYLVYVLISMLVIITFSEIQDFRLLIPIFPFFLYFLFLGLSAISLSYTIPGKRTGFRLTVSSAIGLGLVLLSLFYFSKAVAHDITNVKTAEIEGPFSADSLGMFEYIKINTGKNDVIISYKPRIMSLFTDRKSFSLRRDFTMEQLLSSDAEYFSHSKKAMVHNVTIKNLKDNFNCVFENDSFILCALKHNSIKK